MAVPSGTAFFFATDAALRKTTTDPKSLSVFSPTSAALLRRLFLSEAPLHPEAVRIRFYFQSGIPDDPRLRICLRSEADDGLPPAIMVEDLDLEAGLIGLHGDHVACHVTI